MKTSFLAQDVIKAKANIAVSRAEYCFLQRPIIVCWYFRTFVAWKEDLYFSLIHIFVSTSIQSIYTHKITEYCETCIDRKANVLLDFNWFRIVWSIILMNWERSELNIGKLSVSHIITKIRGNGKEIEKFHSYQIQYVYLTSFSFLTFQCRNSYVFYCNAWIFLVLNVGQFKQSCQSENITF